MDNAIHESSQYSARSIRRYERIFGADFLSSGGLETTTPICKFLDIKPGTRVLDVGSGLGGSAFHMNALYGAVVTGVDILPQMVSIANERTAERGIEGVSFTQGDILEMDLPAASFDLAYSRDAFLHIEDKPALFKKLHGLLAPKGRVFVSDYVRGSGDVSQEFSTYSDDTGYFLEELEAYGAIIEAAGFKDVQVMNKTDVFIDVLKREIERIRGDASGSGNEEDAEDNDYLADRWERKVRWCGAGDMLWGHFYASRP